MRASMHTQTGTLAHTNRCTHLHPFHASQEVLDKKELYKEEYKTIPNRPPKETTAKTYSPFPSGLFLRRGCVYEEAGGIFSFQKSFTQAFPKDLNQVKYSVCFYIVG